MHASTLATEMGSLEAEGHARKRALRAARGDPALSVREEDRSEAISRCVRSKHSLAGRAEHVGRRRRDRPYSGDELCDGAREEVLHIESDGRVTFLGQG